MGAHDPSLLRRRRTVEATAFVARGIGIVSTALFAAGALGSSLPARAIVACLAGIVAMTFANVLAAVNFREPDGHRYSLFSAVEMAADVLVMCGLVVGFQIARAGTVWPGLAVSIVVAAQRHQRRGALIAWAVTSACFAITLLALGDRAVRPQDLPVAVGLNLIIALVSGTQSAALERQVRELEQARRALEHQASHDGLTGLPNRARLEKYASTLDGRALTVLVLDLNGFKNINDTRGHAAGDELLRAIGERLGTTLRGGDVAGRLGGDEFLVLLPDAEPDQAAEVVARLRTEIAQPVEIDGRASAVGASIGAARREAGSPRSLTSLMAEADAAMYKEKIDITVSSEAR